MLKDIVLLGIGALFGLGACLMSLAAPLYFPNAPPSVWHWFFWAGLAIMILMIADAGILLLCSPGFLRFGPVAVANVALMGLVAAAIWQTSYPRLGQVPSSPPPYVEEMNQHPTNKLPRCCLTTPQPGGWAAGVDDSADPRMCRVMKDITLKLHYRMPIEDLIWAMKASIHIDSRTHLGGDIQRCLLSNAAHRLEVLALQIEPSQQWKHWRDRWGDAWAVIRGRAAAIYLKDSES